MKVQQALAELGHFGKTAADGNNRHGMLFEIFQHAAGKIAHIDQSDVGQSMKALNGFLRRMPRRPRNMGDAGGPRHIDAAMDRRDPSCAGKRDHNAGRSQNGKAADNAEPTIQRAKCQLLSAGDSDFNDHIARAAGLEGGLFNCDPHHIARHGIDRGLARRHHQTRTGYRSNALARFELNTGTNRPEPNGRDNPRTMRHIRIIARILDHGRAGEAVAEFSCGNSKSRTRTVGQQNIDRIRKFAGHQRRIGRARCSGRAGTSGPAALQLRQSTQIVNFAGFGLGHSFSAYCVQRDQRNRRV